MDNSRLPQNVARLLWRFAAYFEASPELLEDRPDLVALVNEANAAVSAWEAENLPAQVQPGEATGHE